MQAEDRLDVERLGGLAGFGLPGSRLRSVGQLAGHAINAPDRQRLARLFAGPVPAEPAGAADGFRYRLSLHRPGAGAPAVIEVPEAALPAVVRDCVSDELI